MLKPAICYKTELEDALKQYFYTDDMMYYTGSNDNYSLEISNSCENGRYQWVVINEDESLIGYIGYHVDRYSSCVYNLSTFSFIRGNPIMGKELYNLLNDLIQKYHRVEFRAISENPAIKGYDKFLESHNDIGRKYIFKDTFKDASGKYHDDYIYEFINPEV